MFYEIWECPGGFSWDIQYFMVGKYGFMMFYGDIIDISWDMQLSHQLTVPMQIYSRAVITHDQLSSGKMDLRNPWALED